MQIRIHRWFKRFNPTQSPWNAPVLISIPPGCASQGYKGTAIVEICTEPGGPYLLSGCGAKRCIAPEAKAMKYYKLEVPGNLGDCPGVNQHRRAKAMVSLGECFANGVLCQTSMLVYKRICSIWKIKLEISMFEITYCKTYSKHILFTNVSQITWNERSNIEIYFAEVRTTYFCWELFFPKLCFGCRYLFWRVSVFFHAVDGIFPVFHLDFPILRSWVLGVKNPGLSQQSQQSQQSRAAVSLTKTLGSLTWSCRGPMVFHQVNLCSKPLVNFFMGLCYPIY